MLKIQKRDVLQYSTQAGCFMKLGPGKCFSLSCVGFRPMGQTGFSSEMLTFSVQNNTSSNQSTERIINDWFCSIANSF